MSTDIETVVAIPATELAVTIPLSLDNTVEKAVENYDLADKEYVREYVHDRIEEDTWDQIRDSVSDMITDEAWSACEDQVDDLLSYKAWDYVEDSVTSLIEDIDSNNIEPVVDMAKEYRNIVRRAYDHGDKVTGLCGDGDVIYEAILYSIMHMVKHAENNPFREFLNLNYGCTCISGGESEAHVVDESTGEIVNNQTILSADERLLILDKQVDKLKQEVSNLKDALLVATKNVVHTLEAEV